MTTLPINVGVTLGNAPTPQSQACLKCTTGLHGVTIAGRCVCCDLVVTQPTTGSLSFVVST